MAATLAIRRAWRPPAKLVLSQVDDGEGIKLGEEPPPNAEHVGVVVETRKASRLDGGRHDCANTTHLSRRNGHTLSRGADEDAKCPGIPANGIAHRARELRVIAGSIRIGPQVHDLSPLGAQARYQSIA